MPQGNNQLWLNMLLLLFFVGLMYLMLIRPQRKRDKETREMRDALKKGDKILTIGGIVGTINKVNDENVIIEVGKDRVKLEMVKSSIANIMNSAPESKSSKAKKEESAEEEAAPVNRSKKISPKKISSKKDSAKESVEEKAEEAVEITEEAVSEAAEK